MDIKNMGNNNLPRINFKAQNSESHPELIRKFVTEISQVQNPHQVYDIFKKYSAGGDCLSELPNGAYNYDEYYIYQGMKQYFEDDINGLTIANKIGSKSAPQLVSVAHLPSDRVVVVTKIPNSKDGQLFSFDECKDKLPLIERLHALDEFKRMLANDFINESAIASTENWLFKSDNELVLSDWKNLRKVFDIKEKFQLLERAETLLGLEKDERNLYSVKD